MRLHVEGLCAVSDNSVHCVNVTRPRFVRLSPAQRFVDCFCFGFIYRYALHVWGRTAYMQPSVECQGMAITISMTESAS